jgi:geranylgeranyl pyrophosphate synthase
MKRSARFRGPNSTRRYLNALLEGNGDGAWAAVTALRADGASISEIYVNLLTPAMASMGELWSKGKINVAQQKLATEITLEQMDKLRAVGAANRKSPHRVLVCCIQGEPHATGARMVADLFRLEGYMVDFLGPDVPTESVVAYGYEPAPANSRPLGDDEAKPSASARSTGGPGEIADAAKDADRWSSNREFDPLEGKRFGLQGRAEFARWLETGPERIARGPVKGRPRAISERHRAAHSGSANQGRGDPSAVGSIGGLKPCLHSFSGAGQAEHQHGCDRKDRQRLERTARAALGHLTTTVLQDANRPQLLPVTRICRPLGRKEKIVLAPYEKLERTRSPREIRVAKSAHSNGSLPAGAELTQLLALRHGAVGEEIWHAALMKPVLDLATRPAKHFRARLVELAYRLTSGAVRFSPMERERCDILANVAELIHAGSLIVDDIQDGSTIRRGAPALHLRYGVPLALNAGNWLYFWPFELIKKVGLSKQGEILAAERCQRMLLRAHFGQALDVGTDIERIEQNQVPGVCLAAMELKSGALMGFALVLGGLLAGVSERGLSVLDQFGHDLGVALQMFDDLGNVQGKREPAKQYEDLLLGRPSWVWACAARDYGRDDYLQFAEAVHKLPDRESLESWLERSGLIEGCRRRAVLHMNASYERLAEKLDKKNVSWSHEVFRELRCLGKTVEEAYA